MKTKLLILSIAVLCLSATPTMASIVWFDIEETVLTLNAMHADIIFEAPATFNNPRVVASIQDSSGSKLDYAILGGTATNFDMNLDFVKIAANTYTATGDFFIEDSTNSIKASGDFQSTSVNLSSGWLTVTGPLVPMAGTSILVPATDPWTFTGDTLLTPAGLDLVQDQITVFSNVSTYGNGFVWVMHFSVPYSDLDDMFTAAGLGSVILYSGDVDITVTPVPAAILLGVLGLGVAGIKLRKYA